MTLTKLITSQIIMFVDIIVIIFFLMRNLKPKKHRRSVFAALFVFLVLIEIPFTYLILKTGSVDEAMTVFLWLSPLSTLFVIFFLRFYFQGKLIDNFFKFYLFLNLPTFSSYILMSIDLLLGFTYDIHSVSFVSDLPRFFVNLFLNYGLAFIICFLAEKALPWLLKKQWLLGLSLLFMLFPSISMWFILIFQEITKRSGDMAYGNLLIPSIVFSFIFFLVIMVVKILYDNMTQKNMQREMSILDHQVKLQYDYFLAMESNREQIKKLRHDMTNHFQTLKLLLAANKPKDAEEYLDELCGEYRQVPQMTFSSNMAINAVLVNKQSLCAENEIAFTHDIRVPKKISIRDIDIVSAVANMMDNAIEACLRQKKGEPRFIDFSAFPENNCLLFQINNSHCSDEPLPKIGKTLKYRKTDHGFGLQILQEIATRYNGKFNIVAEKSSVTTSLLICLGEQIDDG